MGSILILLAATGCSEGGTPKTSDDPDVVAGFSGSGQILRAEFDAYEPPGDEIDDPQVVEMRDEDWRIAKMRDLAFRKILIESSKIPEGVVDASARGQKAAILKNAMKWELGWNQIPVSMEEIREEYDSNPDIYIEPLKLQTQYIYKRAETAEMTANERDVVRQELERIRQEILEGADFSDMARRHSDSATAKTGGFYTVAVDHDIFPAFLQAIQSVEVGEITEIIDTPTGFHIAKVAAKIPGYVREFDAQIDHARKGVQAKKLKKIHEDFIAEVGPKFGLVTNYEALEDPFVPDETPLVTIGDLEYTVGRLGEELNDHYVVHLYTGHFPRVHQHLDEIVVDALLYREALERGLDQREDLELQIEEAYREARYALELARLEKEYVAKVPEDELRDYYMQNEKRYQTLKTFDIDVILLKKREDEETLWQTLKRAEGLVERLRAGEDFATLARKHSRHLSVRNDGRMEALTSYGIAYLLQPKPAFTGLINSLEEGEVGDPILAEAYDPKRLVYIQTGILIARLAKVNEPVPHGFEDVVSRVMENYQRRYHQKIVEEIKADVLAASDLQIYMDHLPAL